MPSSRVNIIPTILWAVMNLRPKSILDIGIGFGKYGFLFREYLDICPAVHNPSRYKKENWQIKIDGVEIYENYISNIQKEIYDNIFVSSALDVLPRLGNYDLIFLGDIIEHFKKNKGQQLLKMAYEKANKMVIVTTPKYDTAQVDVFDNPYERHQSLWTKKDFAQYKNKFVLTVDKTSLIIMLSKGDQKIKIPKYNPRIHGYQPLLEKFFKNAFKKFVISILGEERARLIINFIKKIKNKFNH